MKRCCIIGHRKVANVKNLRANIKNAVVNLVSKYNVTVFLFGSKSEFNDLCYEIITETKLEYPEIERVYIRAEYPQISREYKNYLLSFYEDSFYYDDSLYSGKLSYVKRNQTLIDKSDYCLFYYNKVYSPVTNTKSGTHLAFDYAVKKGKTIINLFEN